MLVHSSLVTNATIDRVLATCVLLIVAVGCQPNAATVSGKVTLDGKPLAIAADSRGTVVFQSVGGHGITATGLLEPTGHFKLATGASPDIAPGKYQVAVSVAQLLPRTEGAEQSAKRITPAKYASAGESGLQADVQPGENRFEFDLISSADEAIPLGASSTPSESHVPQPAQSSAGNN